jgi:hypothetical protein
MVRSTLKYRQSSGGEPASRGDDSLLVPKRKRRDPEDRGAD